MEKSEIVDFLIENRIELRRIIKPTILTILKNQDMFLPFEFKDRIKENVTKVLITQLNTTFDLNAEDSMVILTDEKVENALGQLFYDPTQYSTIN